MCSSDLSATPSGEVVNGGTVTESGATVTVNDASSPINGAQIKIAADTLVEPEQFTLSYEDKLPGALNADALALGAKALSKVIVLTRTGSVDFGRPVEITVPFDKTQLPADGVPIVVYWDVSTSSYSPIAVTAVDRDKGTITFVTAHASQFVVLILDKLFGSASPDHNLFTTDMGFRPSVDGFFVHNFGSYDAPGGNCFGMAAYSAWYEHAKKTSRGAGLMSLYLQGDAAKEEDDQVARELIALEIGRAHV